MTVKDLITKLLDCNINGIKCMRRIVNMANAYECDRCKCLYTNNSGYRSSDVYITTTPKDTTGLKDLCPACHEKLRVWWYMEEEKKEVKRR